MKNLRNYTKTVKRWSNGFFKVSVRLLGLPESNPQCKKWYTATHIDVDGAVEKALQLAMNDK